jgi:hypothetical protein
MTEIGLFRVINSEDKTIILICVLWNFFNTGKINYLLLAVALRIPRV